MNANLIVVLGADGGVGSALVEALKEERFTHATTENFVLGLVRDDFDFLDDGASADDIANRVWGWTRQMYDHHDIQEANHILVNCVGVNYIEWFPEMRFEQFDNLMMINVKGWMQALQDLLGGWATNHSGENWFDSNSHKGTFLNIISNASHVPMTNSAFYNASKGAQHMATMSIAREIRKTHGVCVFGVSPNKLKSTGMSDYIEGRVPELRGWTSEEAAKYQMSALPAGDETDPYELAEFISFLLSSPDRHKYLTNTVLPYGA